jgi:release factor glutamine methyltransferase
MPDTATSLRCLLRQASARLAEAGVETGSREAFRLWRDLTGATDPAVALLDPQRAVPPDVVARFEQAVERRRAGEPLAYVTGWAGFRRLILRADRRALIPRPETEGLVEHLLARVSSGRVADLGTGSGCIALSLAQEGSFERVVAVDRSPEALRLAAENRRLTGLPVELVQGDMGESLRCAGFDAIVSNPPYLTEEEYAALDPSVRDWEPAQALASGADGLETTRALLLAGLALVRPGGWIAIETDCSRAGTAAREAGQAGWSAVAVYDDLFGRARYLLARRSERP